MNFFSFILRRATRHWQILVTLSLGVLLSTALLASGPVLVNTVVEFGLRRTLISAEPLAGNLRLRAFGRMDAATYDTLNRQVQERARARLGDVVADIVPTVGARWLFPWLEEQTIPDQRVILRFYGLGDNDIADRVNFVAGGWPVQTVVDEGVAAAVIGEEMAAAYGLTVGDRLPLSLRTDEQTPGYALEISGIIQAREPNDRYWFGEFSPLRALSDERWSAQYDALVPADSFFTVSETLFPDTNYELAWIVLLAPEAITADAIHTLRTQLAQLGSDVRALSPPITIETGLDDALANFAAQTEAVRAPLYFLTAEVVLLILYYVVMVAALAVRQVEREFAVLQSRGASGNQIFRIQAGEALLIGLVAFISGPLLAALLVRGLTLAGPLADVREPGWALSLPQAAWLAAGVGALACIVGLLLPVGPAVRRTIVTYQQSAARDTAAPFWQRYYLDVFILAIGLILLWRLHYYGGIVGGSGARPRVDWLLLLSPIALLVGSGTILLRLFPLVLRLLSAVTSKGRGLPAALAMWQASRNPNHVARLVLLLTLAMSLGILATGINATLDESEVERSHYTAGSDIRLVSRRAISLSQLAETPNVVASSGMWRSQGSATIGRSYYRYDVLAIDPATFGALTTYREDFADQPMPELLDKLVLAEIQGQPTLPLPGEPARFGLWLWSESDEEDTSPGFRPMLIGDSDLDRLALEAKIQTAQGEMLTLKLTSAESGGYPPEGWRYFDGELPSLSAESYPLALHSIWLRNRARTAGAFGNAQSTTFNLAIDELTVVDSRSGETLVANDMESLTEIWFLDGFDAVTQLTRQRAHSGQASQRLSLRMGPRDLSGFRLARSFSTFDPLPALVSPSFLEALQAAVGDVVEVTVDSLPARFHLVGVVNYFPTMYEDNNGGYLITNRDGMLAYLNSFSNRSVNVNEALLATTAEVPPETVSAAAQSHVPTISQAWEAETVRVTIKADPMALGLRSVTFFGYILTTTLSLVGFATYFYMNARQKEAIYGVLRSIGLSPRQLYGTLVLEQVVLILAGLAIGTALGVVLNQMTLPGLPITFGDRPPTPPFVARNDWTAVGRIYLTLAIAFFFSLGIATTLLWQTKLHRVLRVGEE